jgi:hypothetical protein
MLVGSAKQQERAVAVKRLPDYNQGRRFFTSECDSLIPVDVKDIEPLLHIRGGFIFWKVLFNLIGGYAYIEGT